MKYNKCPEEVPVGKANPKIAIVHDFMTKLGGAEKVLSTFCEMYPEAPIYTILYDEEGTKGLYKNRKIITSSLQKLPKIIRKRQKFLLNRFEKAVEEFDFSEFDIVISSSNSYSHGIVTDPQTFHLCYCYSPMRYVWDWYHEYLKENNIGFGPKGLIVRYLLHNIRIWDKLAVPRVDKWVAISEHVAKRIKKYYRVDSKIIYSPVNVSDIVKATSAPIDKYVIVSRIEPYKKIDLAVNSFNKSGRKLVIIGIGSQLEALKKMAKNNIEFLGWQSDESVYEYMQKCKAFIFPGEEDYGITPIESMASGRPVIAFNKGGVTETVIKGKTGTFFNEDTPESLNKAIDRLEKDYKAYSVDACRAQAEKFSKENFIKQFNNYLYKAYENYLKEIADA